jgi:hypothetical protein
VEGGPREGNAEQGRRWPHEAAKRDQNPDKNRQMSVGCPPTQLPGRGRLPLNTVQVRPAAALNGDRRLSQGVLAERAAIG